MKVKIKVFRGPFQEGYRLGYWVDKGHVGKNN
jgi:hypothetical protein